MGLLDFIKKQFIDVIEWTEEKDGILVYRYPMKDREIQNGAQLTVRQTQLALFVNEGEVADLFEPGLHTLSTQNLPILTSLKHWDKLFSSPFKSDLYFFSTREQINQRWGTTNPIVIRDQEFGAIRLRAHGIYSYRISNPKIFFEKISGTRESYTTEELEGQLRGMILTHLASFFGAPKTAFIDMAANQTLFSETLKETLKDPFAAYGLALQSFWVQSLSLPEELQSYLDKAASIKMVGNLKGYAQFQAADSLKAAAENPSGTAGIGAGLGAGVFMGQNLQGLFDGQDSKPQESTTEDPIQLIEKLHGLVTKGILSQQEFEAKKAELLKRIS